MERARLSWRSSRRLIAATGLGDRIRISHLYRIRNSDTTPSLLVFECILQWVIFIFYAVYLFMFVLLNVKRSPILLQIILLRYLYRRICLFVLTKWILRMNFCVPTKMWTMVVLQPAVVAVDIRPSTISCHLQKRKLTMYVICKLFLRVGTKMQPADRTSAGLRLQPGCRIVLLLLFQ